MNKGHSSRSSSNLDSKSADSVEQPYGAQTKLNGYKVIDNSDDDDDTGR